MDARLERDRRRLRDYYNALLKEAPPSRKRQLIYWNPLVKQFEPLPCSHCGNGAFAIAFTNDEVAPLCAKCAAASSSAQKS